MQTKLAKSLRGPQFFLLETDFSVPAQLGFYAFFHFFLLETYFFVPALLSSGFAVFSTFFYWKPTLVLQISSGFVVFSTFFHFFLLGKYFFWNGSIFPCDSAPRVRGVGGCMRRRH